MLYIETNTKMPHLNLSYEEYFLTQSYLSEDIFMLWQNNPTIVIGRFQNTLEEIDRNYVQKNNINVIRRITGGGAVYHDLGNLCYSFILNDISPENTDFSIFAEPIIKALSRIGIKAEISGRNDITIDGLKFSGTAMCIHKNKLLFHGTLLYDSDLSVLSKALNVSSLKIQSKGIQSVRSRVTNIKPYLNSQTDIHEFKRILKQEIFYHKPCTDYLPTKIDIQEIEALAEKKYLSWNWVYGNDPEATLINTRHYNGGIMKVYISLDGGGISSCNIRGDFLGINEIESVENMLHNINYTRSDVLSALKNVNIKNHFGTITLEEVIDCIMGM
jgi:lipoate-protein ligase A